MEKKKKRIGRAKGSGWLVRRGANWFACWKHDGVLHKRTTGTGDKALAERKLEELTRIYRLTDARQRYAALAAQVETLDNELAAERARHPALSLAAAWSVYEPVLVRRVSPASVYKAECYYNVLCRWIRAHHPEVREARQVTRGIVREFFDYNCARSSTYSASGYTATFAQMWSALMEHDASVREEEGDASPNLARIDANVWTSAPVHVRHQAFSRRELTLDELSRIYAAATGELRTLFALGLYTGLRLGDCALLDWSQIDMSGGFIGLTPRKTAHTSGIRIREAIPRPLLELLSATPPERRQGPVLPEIAAAYSDRPMRVIRQVQSVFRACGIVLTVKTDLSRRRRTLVGFHSLRHTYVSLVLNRGGDMNVVQKTVGHTSAEMTGRYLHLDETSLKATAALLPDIRKSAPPMQLGGADFKAVYRQLDAMDLIGLERVRAYADNRIGVLRAGL